MFRSFFLAGFDSGFGRTPDGRRLDQVSATHHERRIMEDYTTLYSMGLLAAREGVRWPLVDLGDGEYDFSSIDPFLMRARYVGLQIIFDLGASGFPDWIDPFSLEFPSRYADYCRATAKHIAEYLDGPYTFAPISEPSYLAWAGGEVGLVPPFAHNRGSELKLQLMRAVIGGINAIREEVPEARIVNTDPLVRTVGRPGRELAAEAFNQETVFESWDILAGRRHPELGGSPEHLDIVGPVYYPWNQWDVDDPSRTLTEDDPRWCSLSEMLRQVWHRYRREMLLAATADVGESRARHLEWVTNEAETVLDDMIPLLGVCLHPILGKADWNAQEEWAQMGLWDVGDDGSRKVHEPTLRALRYGQRRLENLGIPKDLLLEGPYLG